MSPLQGDCMLLGRADRMGLSLAPAEIPTNSESPSKMMQDRNEPGTGAGGDYTAFVAVGEMAGSTASGYLLQQLVQNSLQLNLGPGNRRNGAFT